MTDIIQFKEDKKSRIIYMYLLSNDGIIFKYTINVKSKEIILQNQYIIKCIQKQRVYFFKAIDQDNFVVATSLNEIIYIKRLKGNEFHIFQMIIDQKEYVVLNDDNDVLLPVIESIPLDEKRNVFINTFQIVYINNHFVLWVEQKDNFDKSSIKYLYLGDNNKLSDSLEGYCPEIWLPLITNNIIENTDGTTNNQKKDEENSVQYHIKAKETVINIDDDKIFPRSLSTLSFSNFSLLSDINDIPSMPSYDNNNNYDEDEQDSIELIKEYYLNYIFNINKFSLSILYYALLRYSEESSITAFVDQTELKHIGLNYIKKCIVNCINERINSNAINSADRNNVEKEYKKFLYYCIMEYESENKFISFLQYSQENVKKINVPMFILIKKAYITTINICDTSEVFYNALTNKHSMMELQYLFSITDLNKKNSYHNVSSSMSLFLSAIDQLYRNKSSFEKFGINKSNQNSRNSTLNIQQLTRDVIIGICKSSMRLENLVENIYWDYLDDNESFLKKIRKLKDVKGCIDYVFNILSDQGERIIPLENIIQNRLRNKGKISKSYITYLTQLISVNVKEVINARYHLCFHLFIILIALYIIDKKSDSNKGSTESQINRVGLFSSGIDHFEYLNYLYRCRSYLHALIILKWASEYSDSKDQLLISDEQIMELSILKNLSITNVSKNSTKRDINNNDILINAEKVKYILTYFNINKVNVDEKIDKTVLSHANDSILFSLIYSSVLSLVKIDGENDEEEKEICTSDVFDMITSTNYFSLYPSDLVKESISLLDIIYDYSHRYLDTINLSWYSSDTLSSPLVSFIIQLIQHSSNSIYYLKELLPSINSSCIFLLQGIISLIANDIKKSEEYFKKASAAFDIRKEYYLSLSKLELSKNHKESETSILSLDPVDAVTLYISLGKYDTAVSFSLLYGFDLSIIFQNLLLQYVKSSFMIINSNSNYITEYFDKVMSKGGNVKAKNDFDEKNVTPTVNLPEKLFMRDGSFNNVTIYNYKKINDEMMKQNNNNSLSRRSSYNGQRTSVVNNTIDFRKILKKFLDLHDSPDNYYRYHKVVIEKFLETCITSEVPGWLIEPFMVSLY
ncbi:hypothetical protein PIROE2DRAFT_59897 [Piromyces sp. E2]|nr:hypothetical protein PIROE2DRAFT_59897 [Piromyces sp. E2]|eukprot:OUM65603.1 hypothetical protein PIROE2DRAFT_59897 [Piromyces sp. E2]